MPVRQLPDKVNDLLVRVEGGFSEIIAVSTVGGGCINNALKIQTTRQKYFLKYNSASRFPGMFSSEARGLKLLADTQTLTTPNVIGVNEQGGQACLPCNGQRIGRQACLPCNGQRIGRQACLPYNGQHIGRQAWILLEYIEQGQPQNGFWEEFGTALAILHQHTCDDFGLDHDNYIGSLPQSNAQHPTWIDFFMHQRLEPQLNLARSKGLIESSLDNRFINLYKALPSIFPAEPPSLIHGDLWNGNFMTGRQGHACLIDPAVYYGFREMDIAMSKLFGGFHQRFYEAYNHAFPMAPGWQQRIAICNLYPVLVHVNLFGGGHIAVLNEIMRQF